MMVKYFSWAQAQMKVPLNAIPKVINHTRSATLYSFSFLWTQRMVPLKQGLLTLQSLGYFKVVPKNFSHGPVARQIVHQFPAAFGRPVYALP